MLSSTQLTSHSVQTSTATAVTSRCTSVTQIVKTFSRATVTSQLSHSVASVETSSSLVHLVFQTVTHSIRLTSPHSAKLERRSTQSTHARQTLTTLHCSLYQVLVILQEPVRLTQTARSRRSTMMATRSRQHYPATNSVVVRRSSLAHSASVLGSMAVQTQTVITTRL